MTVVAARTAIRYIGDFELMGLEQFWLHGIIVIGETVRYLQRHCLFYLSSPPEVLSRNQLRFSSVIDECKQTNLFVPIELRWQVCQSIRQ